MLIETELRTILDGSSSDDKKDRQLANFDKFQRRLNRSGYQIEKKKFSIPLMERLGCSYLKD